LEFLSGLPSRARWHQRRDAPFRWCRKGARELRISGCAARLDRIAEREQLLAKHQLTTADDFTDARGAVVELRRHLARPHPHAVAEAKQVAAARRQLVERAAQVATESNLLLR